jgi:hypothetical protein
VTLRINDNGEDRDMTPAEIAAYETWQAEAAEQARQDAEAQAERAAIKAAALAKLGLNENEIAALFG